MGRDKAMLLVEGATLLARSRSAVATAIAPAPVATIGLPPADHGGTHGEVAGDHARIPDRRTDAGPLAGLETALAHAGNAGIVLVVGVDHPWLAPDVLSLLTTTLDEGPEHVDAAVLGTGDGPQLLIGAYRTRTLATLGRLLDGGERRLHALLDHLDVEVVAPTRWRLLDPLGATAVDVDDPHTLEQAISWHARARATTAAGDHAQGTGPAGATAPEHLAAPGVTVTRVRDGRAEHGHDTVVGEEPLEIRAAGPDQEPVTLVTTLRTPGHERELAVGWVLADGVATARDILAAETGDPLELARPEDSVTVRLRGHLDAELVTHRHALATASCGVCGRATIDEVTARVPPVTDDPYADDPVTWTRLTQLPDELRLAQPRFQATGGLHATGLFDRAGRLVTIREDVGRHNALDAVIGAHALAGVWPAAGLHDLICVLSGRIGFELVAKAAVARLPIVCGIGAASDLAVRTADRLGITLVGFLRGATGTIYTHPGRVDLATPTTERATQR
jgi:FdhD protein